MTACQQASIGGGGPKLPVTITIARISGTPAEFILNADGRIQQRATGGAVTDIGFWLPGAGGGSAWEVNSSVLTGSFTTDPSAGAYINLNTTRIWQRAAGIGTIQTVTATINIRNVASGVVATTSTLSLQDDNS